MNPIAVLRAIFVTLALTACGAEIDSEPSADPQALAASCGPSLGVLYCKSGACPSGQYCGVTTQTIGGVTKSACGCVKGVAPYPVNQ